MENRLIQTLKRTLPNTIIIHMNPYDTENKEYYRKHEITRPNPKFPPKSNSSYNSKHWEDRMGKSKAEQV